jgi:hypothetical protein
VLSTASAGVAVSNVRPSANFRPTVESDSPRANRATRRADDDAVRVDEKQRRVADAVPQRAVDGGRGGAGDAGDHAGDAVSRVT